MERMKEQKVGTALGIALICLFSAIYIAISYYFIDGQLKKYGDNYYIVAGKYKNTGSLYWFDREHTLQNNNGGCYEIYSAPVYWCSTQPSTTMTYYPSSDVKILNIIPCTASSTPLFIPCSD